jgi:hypothetical protein
MDETITIQKPMPPVGPPAGDTHENIDMDDAIIRIARLFKESLHEKGRTMSDAKECITGLKLALGTDPDYAQGWHDNIAMCCYDAMRSEYGEKLDHKAAHRLANDGAARFMKLCFGINTSRKTD